MSLFKSQATANTKLLGYPVQTSVKGLPIPVVFGTNRVGGNVVWTGDWVAQAVGSKGKGGGGKGGANQQYDYHSAIIIALCHGQIANIGKVWLDRVIYSVSSITEKFTISSTTYNPQFSGGGAFAGDNGVSAASAYSVTNNDYGSPGSTTFSGSQQIPLQSTNNPSPGPGQYYVDPTTGIYTFNAADVGKQVELSYTWNQFSSSGGGAPAPNIGLTIIEGLIGQSAWSFLTSNHPSQAIGYSGLAIACSQDFDLGASGVLTNLLFEIYGLDIFGGGWLDAEPSTIIRALISDPVFGVSGFPGGEIGSLTEIQNYCTANGLFISPVIDNQKSALEWIRDILLVANSEGFWSEGKIKFRTYGDVTAVGNGTTFAPNNSPIYDLNELDYLEPIKVERKSVKDVANRYTVEWSNRANNYNVEPLSEDDDWSISKYGLRPDSPNHLPMICVHSVAQKTANVRKKRAVNILNTYTIKLPINYCLLEPMDLVTVSSAYLGLNKFPVRLLTKEEDENGKLTFEAEDFPWGTATPTLHPKQGSARFGPGYFAPPGDVHTPIFFEPTPEQNQNIEKHELLIALAGGQDWGGAEVWISRDNGVSYQSAGRQNGPSTLGVLTAGLTAHIDPDDTNGLAVDLTESGGGLASYTKDQEDSLVPLALIDGEIVSYRTATLTGAFAYTITHMRRGVYSTPIQAHASGTRFLYFDEGLFNWTYDVKDVGKVIIFKFTSFNQAGQNMQELADAAAYSYQIKGPRGPYPLNGDTSLSNMGKVSPDYPYGTAAVKQRYDTQADDSVQPGFQISTHLPPNKFTSVVAPVLSLVSVQTTGGSLPGGVRLAFVADILTSGSSGGFSTPSNIVYVDIPAGTNTNKVNLSAVYSGGSSLLIYAAVARKDESRGFVVNTSVSAPTATISVTDLFPSGEPVPDPRFYSVELRASKSIAGVYRGAVLAPGTFTLQFSSPGWATNQFAGRYILKVATFDNGAVGLIESKVISNSSDTLNLDGSFNLTGLVTAGDVFIIRSQPTSCTSRVVTDTLWNLTASAHRGSFLWCIGGTGAGQKVQIADNTTTAVTLAYDLTTILDSTSIVIIVEASPTAVLPIPPISVGSSADDYNLVIPVDNAADSVFLVQVFLVDRYGDLSDEILSPFREIFQYGAAAAPGTPDGYYNTVPSGGHVPIEITNGRNQITLLSASSQYTIDNPTNSGGAPVPGDWLELFFIQQAPGLNPTPLWGSAFGADIQALQFDGSDITKPWTAMQITYHGYDNLWHYDSFSTGK